MSFPLALIIGDGALETRIDFTNSPMKKIGCSQSPPDDVATRLAAVAVGTLVNRIVELAGPEPLPLDELVRLFLGATEARHMEAELCRVKGE